jgi:hypothetical protein
MDAALRNDLSMAAQPYMPQQYMSPLEAGYAGYGTPNAYNPQNPYGYGAQRPVYAPAQVQRAGTIRRAPSGSGARSGGVVVRKNTKRDAAIGAVAGAAIGAVTSAKKDRAKGAVLGAAAGAILGGVIGNNVDLTKIRIPR